MKRISPYPILALVAALLAWTLLYWQPQPDGPATAPTLPPGGDFTLQAESGALSLSQFRGKVVLLYFGYTSCPDICPTSLTLMSIALARLGEAELAQVQGLFVSVDPPRDTPERLAQYSSHFHPNIIGITGSADQVAEVAQRYGAIYRQAEGETALGYTVDHSSATYLIDPQGRLSAILPHGTAPQEILQQVRQLLQKN